MYTSNCYMKIPHIKSLELTSWSRSYFSSDMVLISLYIKCRNKGGALFSNTSISAAALIRERRLLQLRRLIDHLRYIGNILVTFKLKYHTLNQCVVCGL